MSQDYNGVVGKMIKSLRESRGESLRQLAEVLGIQYPSLFKIEKGDQKIDMDILMKVAEHYQVSVYTLLNQEESATSTSALINPPPVTVEPRGNFRIKEALERVLTNYLSARGQRFANHEMAQYVRNELPNIISEDAGLDESRYFVVGSTGMGQWAEVPWLSIFARNITTTATSGYYIVYLFKANMTGFYLSLNQGYSYFRGKYGTKEGRKKVRRTAQLVREQLNTVPEHLRGIKIDLASRNDLGKGYEAGNIFARYYALDSLPSSEEMIGDLKSMLLAYHEVESLMRGRTTNEFNDYLLLEDDEEYLEEDEVKYQETVNIVATTVESEEYKEDEEGPRERPKPIVDKGGRQHWPRNAKTAATALRLSGYKCAFDKNHTTFISKVTGKPYNELHHLVPMSLQDKFIYDLDRTSNIRGLCPTCHRAIHHGEDEVKSKIIEKLYKDSRDGLEAIGIEITLSDLKKAYGIK